MPVEPIVADTEESVSMQAETNEVEAKLLKRAVIPNGEQLVSIYRDLTSALKQVDEIDQLSDPQEIARRTEQLQQVVHQLQNSMFIYTPIGGLDLLKGLKRTTVLKFIEAHEDMATLGTVDFMPKAELLPKLELLTENPINEEAVDAMFENSREVEQNKEMLSEAATNAKMYKVIPVDTQTIIHLVKSTNPEDVAEAFDMTINAKENPYGIKDWFVNFVSQNNIASVK